MFDILAIGVSFSTKHGQHIQVEKYVGAVIIKSTPAPKTIYEMVRHAVSLLFDYLMALQEVAGYCSDY